MTTDPGTAYTNENDDMAVTYDCFLDGWCNPVRVYEEGSEYKSAVLDLGFGNRDEDQENYAALAGLIASPGPNRMFDRMTGLMLDPNLQRSGSNPGGMLGSEGQEDDDVFTPLYKRDLFANIAPDSVIEGLGADAAINTPVDIQVFYKTGKLPDAYDVSGPDSVSGIAVIYPDPKQAPGFNVVRLMESGTPIAILSPTNQHIYKESFEKMIQTNQFIPVGYAFFYIRVLHHPSLGSQKRGYCQALEKLGWQEATETVYGERVCVKSGTATISVQFALEGGGRP
jgi:hypothetical protein